jgi:hypothetical protein
MRGVCACAIVLAVALGCGKKRATDRSEPEPETVNPGPVAPDKGGIPNPKLPGTVSVNTAPDTSGFSLTDSKLAVQWLGTEFERIQKRDPRDPRYGGKAIMLLHEEMEQVLVGKSVRWPLPFESANKNGLVKLRVVQYPESGEPTPATGESYGLVAGTPLKTGPFGWELPTKEPRNWLNGVQQGSPVLAVGTIRKVERRDIQTTATVGGAQKKSIHRLWQFDLSPGWVEPLPAGK